MSPDVTGLQVGMKALLENSRKMSARDWRVVPVDWSEKLYQPGRKLKLAYYEEDGMFPPTPGVQRALKVQKVQRFYQDENINFRKSLNH